MPPPVPGECEKRMSELLVKERKKKRETQLSRATIAVYEHRAVPGMCKVKVLTASSFSGQRSCGGSYRQSVAECSCLLPAGQLGLCCSNPAETGCTCPASPRSHLQCLWRDGPAAPLSIDLQTGLQQSPLTAAASSPSILPTSRTTPEEKRDGVQGEGRDGETNREREHQGCD